MAQCDSSQCCISGLVISAFNKSRCWVVPCWRWRSWVAPQRRTFPGRNRISLSCSRVSCLQSHICTLRANLWLQSLSTARGLQTILVGAICTRMGILPRSLARLTTWPSVAFDLPSGISRHRCAAPHIRPVRLLHPRPIMPNASQSTAIQQVCGRVHLYTIADGTYDGAHAHTNGNGSYRVRTVGVRSASTDRLNSRRRAEAFGICNGDGRQVVIVPEFRPPTPVAHR